MNRCPSYKPNHLISLISYVGFEALMLNGVSPVQHRFETCEQPFCAKVPKVRSGGPCFGGTALGEDLMLNGASPVQICRKSCTNLPHGKIWHDPNHLMVILLMKSI